MLRLETLESRCLPSRYTLTDFGPDTVGEALNNRGVAAAGYGRANPFLVEPDGSHVPLRPPALAVLHHLTDSGVVAATLNFGQGTHAAYWDNDGQSLHDLGTLGGPLADANGANDDGVIVGTSTVVPSATYGHAWVDRGAGLEDLGTLPGDTNSNALAVNAAGLIVGSSGRRAVAWDAGGIHPLDVPGEDATSYAVAIAVNDQGWVAGNTFAGSSVTAWVDVGDSAWVLSDLGAGMAEVEGMNGRGEVAGYALSPSGGYHAVLWTRGRVHDLNGPWTPAGWTLRYAAGVNDRGQVVGTALDASGVTHGFLLTPVSGVADWVFAASHRHHDGFTDPAA